MPRRVYEFAQGVDLGVGIDKSWLRGTVTPKQVNVDDWVIMQFDMSDDALLARLALQAAPGEAKVVRHRSGYVVLNTHAAPAR